MGRRAVGGLDVAFGDVQLRLVGDVPHHAGLRAAAEQRTLRALEDLDALQVRHVDIDVARGEGHRAVIEIERDIRKRGDRCARLVAGKACAQAAHVDVAVAGAIAAVGHVRQELEDVIERRDVQLAESVARDRLNGVRDALYRLGTALRGYDDLLEA